MATLADLLTAAQTGGRALTVGEMSTPLSDYGGQTLAQHWTDAMHHDALDPYSASNMASIANPGRYLGANGGDMGAATGAAAGSLLAQYAAHGGRVDPGLIAQMSGPPGGSYDPSLDYQLQEARTGLGYKVADTETQNQRAYNDYLQGLTSANREYDVGMRGANENWGDRSHDIQREQQHLQQGQDRTMHDLGQQRGYLTEDHTTGLANLQRRYTQLGQEQTQQADQTAASDDGGALAQALVQRGQNMALEQQPMDQQYTRSIAANDQSQQRAGQDFNYNAQGLADQGARAWRSYVDQTGDLGYSRGARYGQLAQGFWRPAVDRQTQLTRAQDAMNANALGTLAQKYWSVKTDNSSDNSG